MEKKPLKTNTSPSNLLAELAKAKAKGLAENQGHAFVRFSKDKSRPGNAAKPAFFGGRNGQGKP